MVMVLAPSKRPPEPKSTEPRNRREPEAAVPRAAAGPVPEQAPDEVVAAPAEVPPET
jgi:hypothetical protein